MLPATKVSPIPSSNCFAFKLLVSSLQATDSIGYAQQQDSQKGIHNDSSRTSKRILVSPSRKVLYTAKAPTTGSRDGGASRPDDGRLDVKFTCPGAQGTGTNPEQLFAVGSPACFLSAIKIVAGKKKLTLPADVGIDVEVDLGVSHGVHSLAARLNVSLPGLERKVAQELVDGAHQICPYSRATCGNIDVALNVV